MDTTFTNELGNRIRISVENRTEMGEVPQLAIIMEGPHSVMENIITEREAEMLVQALAAYKAEKN